jgi:gluconolactonase
MSYRWTKFATCAALSASLLAGAGYTASQSKKPPREFALQAEAPEFWKLVAKDAKLEKYAGGFGFTEGPMWDPAGFVYVSDEEKNKIYRAYPDGHSEELISLGDPDGNTFDRQHRLITTASELRAIIEVSPDGKYKVLTNQYDGKKLNTPNDVIVGPDGALYFTDPTLDFVKDETSELGFQGVYRLGPDGKLTLLTRDIGQPNGLAFSPDGKKFYVDDDDQKNIRVYDVGPDMTLSNGRIFGTEVGEKGDGVPDGMKLDVHGNMFVTGPKGIWVWTPEGKHIGTIVMPEQPANLTWGDRDYGTLYITATTSVYKLRTKTHGFVPYLAAAKK